jgi:hypothetical protein
MKQGTAAAALDQARDSRNSEGPICLTVVERCDPEAWHKILEERAAKEAAAILAREWAEWAATQAKAILAREREGRAGAPPHKPQPAAPPT